MSWRLWICALVVAGLVAGCGVVRPRPVETSEPAPTATIENAVTPENVEDRVRAVLARTGGDELVELMITPRTVSVGVVRNDRVYDFGENNSSPNPKHYEGGAQPFTLSEVDLPHMMQATSAFDESCAEPSWKLEALAYDLRTVSMICEAGAFYRFWADDYTLPTISMANQQSALAVAARLPEQAPDQAYSITASSNSQNGDSLAVDYADPDWGLVEVRISNDERHPVRVSVLRASSWQPFEVSAVPVDKIVACGERIMADAGINWWFVNARYSPLHGQVALKWDTGGAWESTGPFTDIDCNVLD